MTGQNVAITMSSVLSWILTNYHPCYNAHSAYPLHIKQRDSHMFTGNPTAYLLILFRTQEYFLPSYEKKKIK